MRNLFAFMLWGTLVSIGPLAFVGCEREGPVEERADTLEEAADEVEDEADDATDEL